MPSDDLQRTTTAAIFRNRSFDYVAQRMLGTSQQGGPPPAALLDAFARIRDGAPASWTRVFTDLAHTWEAAARATSSTQAGAAWASACQAWRAAMLWQEPQLPSAQAATRSMSAAFRRQMSHMGSPLVPTQIPFGSAHLPAFISPRMAEAPRVLIIVGGGDTYVEDLWYFGGRFALARGWHVAMVDLPGQGNTPLHGLHFGPDTLDGLRVTVDHLRAQGFTGEIALLGWSGGGIVTTKFASIARPDDRLRALVASTPVHDPVRMLRHALPACSTP